MCIRPYRLLSDLSDGLVDGSKGRLPGVMEHPSVAMENEDALLLGRITVAPIDTVVRPEVPVAGEHIQVLCTTQTQNRRKHTKGIIMNPAADLQNNRSQMIKHQCTAHRLH